MDVLSFRLVLTRCGVLQVEALDSIVAQGFSSMDDLKRLTEVEIDHFVKAVNKLPAVIPGGVSPQIVFGSIKTSDVCLPHPVVEFLIIFCVT